MRRSRLGVLAVFLAACGQGASAPAPDPGAADPGAVDIAAPGDVPGDTDPAGDLVADSRIDPDVAVDAGPTTPVGAACKDDPECAPGFCAVNFPGGYCLQACDPDPCPAGSYCGRTEKGWFCYLRCTGGEDCRPGYTCAQSDNPHCLPAGDVELYGACADSSQCASGTCIVPYCGEAPCAAGVCSQSCLGGAACPSPGFCAEFAGRQFCMRGCSKTSACPEGQACQPGVPKSYCAPG